MVGTERPHTRRQSPRVPVLEIHHREAQIPMRLPEAEVLQAKHVDGISTTYLISLYLEGFERISEFADSGSTSDGFSQCNSEHTAGSGGGNQLKRVDGVEISTRRHVGRTSLLLGGRIYLLFHIVPVISVSVLFWIELDIPQSQYRNGTNVSPAAHAR